MMLKAEDLFIILHSTGTQGLVYIRPGRINAIKQNGYSNFTSILVDNTWIDVTESVEEIMQK